MIKCVVRCAIKSFVVVLWSHSIRGVWSVLVIDLAFGGIQSKIRRLCWAASIGDSRAETKVTRRYGPWIYRIINNVNWLFVRHRTGRRRVDAGRPLSL